MLSWQTRITIASWTLSGAYQMACIQKAPRSSCLKERNAHVVVCCRIGNIAEAKPEVLQLMWMPDKQGKYELEVRRQIRHIRACFGWTVCVQVRDLN